MRLPEHKRLDEHGRRMLAAAKAADEEDDDPGIASCTQPTIEDTTFRVLMWTLEGLGGDLRVRPVQPDYVIEAYATLVAAVAPDVVVIPGVRRNPGHSLVIDELSDGSTYVRHDVVLDHRGAAEVDRIVEVLARCDAGAGWTAAWPPPPDPPDEIAYVDGRTVVFLYASARPVRLTAIELDGPARGTWAHLVKPEAPSCILPIGAGLAAPDSLPSPSVDMKGAQLVATSSAHDLAMRRTELDGEYEELANEGSVLAPPLWGDIVDKHPALLDNFLALCPGDTHYQDAHMHWEAMPSLPPHPRHLDEVQGQRRDLFVLRHRGSTTRARVTEARVIDLVRAALPSAALGPASEGAEFSKPTAEDSSLQEHYRAFLDEFAPPPGGSSPADDDAVRHLSEAKAFARTLGTHWPVFAELELRSRREHSRAP